MSHELLPSVHSAVLPARYEAAKLAIRECSNLDECKDWSDKMQAMASYARQGADKDLENYAMRIRARAIRRCGELYKEIEKAQPGPKELRGDAPPQLSPRKEAAEAAGMSPDQVKTALRVANVPEEIFNDQVDGDDPPTITNLAQQGTVKRPPPQNAEEAMKQGIPAYEFLGISKAAFQAGMHFPGFMEELVKAIGKYKLQDIIEGCDKKERARIREMIGIIDKFNDEMIVKL